MGFGLTAVAVAEYAAKPFVQRALSLPRSEAAVRSFYLGIDCFSSDAPDLLRDGTFENDMGPLWYAGHEDYDKLCQTFSDVVREAGRRELPTDGEWGTVDGRFARILLCDQLSRNCFRGTDEAFQYDDVALELAREMATEALESDSPSSAVPADKNEIYGTYASVLSLPLMHSESLSDHHLGLDLIEWGRKQSPKIKWEQKKGFLRQHSVVLDQFGRYPHRNGKKGRETTKEEEEWLASEDCPGWAKSQG